MEKVTWNLDTDVEDELPPIDEEVIALAELKDIGTYRVSFAHRVDTSRAIAYGKGGWNIPDVVYWLNAPIPQSTYIRGGGVVRAKRIPTDLTAEVI